jgi:hypothetical protein
MKSDIYRPRQQRFIKLLYTTVLAKAREKEKASVTTAPFFFIVYDNHPSDICLTQIHNKHTDFERPWPSPHTLRNKITH